MASLDPRVNRLPKDQLQNAQPKVPMDQFGTFEVFVQAREGKPFQHEGIVHAPNLEMAYLLAKETFTRRFTCVSIYVADTRNVHVSGMTEGEHNAYDNIAKTEESDTKESYEVYHLLRRGKQHVHVGKVEAANPNAAMWAASKALRGEKQVYNVWVIRSKDIRFTSEEEKEMWLTLPDKKFRDASAYKGGDKLKSFLEKMNQ